MPQVPPPAPDFVVDESLPDPSLDEPERYASPQQAGFVRFEGSVR